MAQAMRKISLIRLTQVPRADCSVPHNTVHKRTVANRLYPYPLGLRALNSVKLQRNVPLATRMLIPTTWSLFPSPIN